MLKNYLDFVGRKYRNADAGADTGGADGNTDTGDTGTILTGAATEDDAAADDSDSGETDTGTSEDDAGNPDESQDDSDAGKEGSDESTDTYADFTLPEGMEIDETALAEAAPLFKEAGLDQANAQKFIDLYAKMVQAGSEKQVNDFNQLMNDWQTASKNDKDFGGDKFEQSVAVAKSAINKYGTPELSQLLEDHGVGNHPEVIRFMVKVGQTLQEDVPGAQGTATGKEPDRVEQMYGPQN